VTPADGSNAPISRFLQHTSTACSRQRVQISAEFCVCAVQTGGPPAPGTSIPSSAATSHAVPITHTHTHTHPFNGPLSGSIRVSRYQKGETNLDFTEARDSEWQWHQLGHMQVCNSFHASTPPLSFLHAGTPSCHPTNSVKALKALIHTHSQY